MAEKPRRMSELEMKLAKWIMGPFSRWNARRYLATDGRSMGTMRGREVCIVTMTGAKSGKRRDVPLMYVPYGEGVLLVASLGGAPKHPTWYYNLVSHPDIDVRVKDRTLRLRARLASPAEKTRVWPTCIEYYPDYANYQARTDRDIPVFICERRT
ncbi:MAG TPA: nitroreductase family deazaflavin-dependent oxidoreductase [Myxococcota bacterium]|nr:nitroreductase family deazaflavin-dependent oxidoreductase [Myxococcota bacterium]